MQFKCKRAMQLILDAAATIQTTTWEDYLYRILRRLQELEGDVSLNPYNFNNITSSETHDAPGEFTAELNLPCQISLTGVTAQSYLPLTSTHFSNGNTGELAGLNLFQSIIKNILFLANVEIEQFAEQTTRFEWSIEKNTERAVNNAIFRANILLPMKQESTTINGTSFILSTAKEIFF